MLPLYMLAVVLLTDLFTPVRVDGVAVRDYSTDEWRKPLGLFKNDKMISRSVRKTKSKELQRKIQQMKEFLQRDRLPSWHHG